MLRPLFNPRSGRRRSGGKWEGSGGLPICGLKWQISWPHGWDSPAITYFVYNSGNRVGREKTHTHPSICLCMWSFTQWGIRNHKMRLIKQCGPLAFEHISKFPALVFYDYLCLLQFFFNLIKHFLPLLNGNIFISSILWSQPSWF